MSAIKVDDTSTRADIAEAIAHVRATYLRGPQSPAHTERHHELINALLDQLAGLG